MVSLSSIAPTDDSVLTEVTPKTLSNKSPAIVYHKGCLDGFGGAFAFYLKYGFDVEYFQGVYQDFDITPLYGREVYFVDFSVSLYDVETLLQHGCKITLLDHHKTAIEALGGMDHPNFIDLATTERSGCILAWEYCFPSKSIPDLFLHIEDRDLWKFEMDGTKEITTALYSLPMTFQSWSQEAFQISKLKDIGHHILGVQAKNIGAILGTSRRSIILHGINVPLINCPHMFVSELSDRVLNEHPWPFVVTYYDTISSRKYSLRSRGDFDVSTIAREFGGGGHPSAAGFSVPRDNELARI
jgi:uncharacterized protein